MTSYYRTINGIQYDRAMLDMADNSINGKRDGRISLADAKKITGKAADAGKITDIEARTLHYIFDHYKFTKTAEDYFSNFATLEREHILADTGPQTDEDIFGIKEFIGKYYLYFLIIALIIFLIYLYSDRLLTPLSTNKFIKEPAPVVDTAVKPDEKNMQAVKIPEAAGENEYLVKEKDTLFTISSALYGDPSKWKDLYNRNKDIIENPSMIYPGQKLRTDIK